MATLYTPEYDRHLFGPRRALSTNEVETLQRGLAAGAKVRDLATAFGVSVRTIYRYKGTSERILTVGGWSATFIVYQDGRSPRQVRPWVQRADA